jgi:hypothetical protein
MAHIWLPRRAGSSEISLRIHSLVKKLCIATALAFNRSAHRRSLRGVKAPPNTWRSRPSLNDDPSLCAVLYTAVGVGELYQRR